MPAEKLTASPTSRPYERVTAFVDWFSQLKLTGIDLEERPVDAAKRALDVTARNIARSLAHVAPELRFRVQLRLYCGWHKGFEPSNNKRAAVQAIAATDFATLSIKQSVTFSDDVGYGDRLASAMPERLHSHLGIHLPNTLRRRETGRGFEEKMVDTALAADLLVSAFQDPDSWVIVAAEDDDLVPPLFVAEAYLQRASSRALLISQRKRKKTFLKLDGILAGGNR